MCPSLTVKFFNKELSTVSRTNPLLGLLGGSMPDASNT